jgi:hypothetical protein
MAIAVPARVKATGNPNINSTKTAPNIASPSAPGSDGSDPELRAGLRARRS